MTVAKYGCASQISTISPAFIVGGGGGGKATLWVQTRLKAWQRKARTFGLGADAIRLSQPMRGESVEGDSGRVLPWIGGSTMCSRMALASLGCNRPRFGGLLNGENIRAQSVLSRMLALVCKFRMQIRLDTEVRVRFSMPETIAVMSSGIVVELEVEGLLADIRPLRTACKSSTDRKVKSSWALMDVALDDFMQAALGGGSTIGVCRLLLRSANAVQHLASFHSSLIVLSLLFCSVRAPSRWTTY